MDTVLGIVSWINSHCSDYVLTVLLSGAGIFFTFKTRFVQVRCFKEGLKNAFGSFSLSGAKNQKGLSSFQALTAAVAAQVGTGNIVGASGAILAGGPGAIFWMWVIAFFGMATSYAEAVLAQKTRQTDANGTPHGGPVYYIKQAFPNFFGSFLAVFLPSVQSFLLDSWGAWSRRIPSGNPAATPSACLPGEWVSSSPLVHS